MGSVDYADLLQRLRTTTKRLDYSPDDWEDEQQDVLAAIAAIESLTKRLAEQTEAKNAAIRLWNECGQSSLMLTAERDELKIRLTDMRDRLELSYKELTLANESRKELELSYDSNLAENDVLVELTATLGAENERLREAGQRVLTLYDSQYLRSNGDGGRVKHAIDSLRAAIALEQTR